MDKKQSNRALKPLQSVKKFYFLDYFFVLLESVDKYSEKNQIFNFFKELKKKYRLGESKYKKLALDKEELSKRQVDRYYYTFEQVIDESKQYKLISEDETDSLFLTGEGNRLLSIYKDKGSIQFNQEMLRLMEPQYGAFRYLIDFLYGANLHKSGLIIIPNYSPRQLQFERALIKTTNHIIEYSRALVKKLQKDIEKHLGKNTNLETENEKLLNKLFESGLLPKEFHSEFDSKDYNKITKRFRDFWINYFLREIYNYQASMSSFDIWLYRGKQMGIIHATEFYPNFHGRIVYPTAVVMKRIASKDFQLLYQYDDGYSLYIHSPNWESCAEQFVESLVKAYFDLRRYNHSYFINLPALRELVCYNLKISVHLFEIFLEETYRLNLKGELKIRIALEVDRLPEETKAMYLKQEPVLVDGKYRNIIAIDVIKGDKK